MRNQEILARKKEEEKMDDGGVGDQNWRSSCVEGSRTQVGVIKAMTLLAKKLGAKNASPIFSHLLGFEEMDSRDDRDSSIFSEATTRLQAAIYGFRAQGHLQAAAALALLAEKWLKCAAPCLLHQHSSLFLTRTWCTCMTAAERLFCLVEGWARSRRTWSVTRTRTRTHLY